jgi:two-component system phosphate regulon sensor histidine kinase PhoR
MITKLEGDLNLEYTDFDIVELIQNVFDLLEMKADKRKFLWFLRIVHLILFETKIGFNKLLKTYL